MCGCVVACKCRKSDTRKVEVIEDVDSRPQNLPDVRTSARRTTKSEDTEDPEAGSRLLVREGVYLSNQ